MGELRQATELLIVDDDPRVRRLLTLLLEQEGYATDTATDGTAALARLETTSPALLLLDLTMPGMDGFELLRRLGNLPAAPPAIVVSARVESRRLATTLGAAAFVAKPFDIDALLSVVTHVLDGAQSANGTAPSGDQTR